MTYVFCLPNSNQAGFVLCNNRNCVSSSMSALKEIGCKNVWLVYISPLFRPIEQLLVFKIVKIYPHPVTFSLRFFKSDRLLAGG